MQEVPEYPKEHPPEHVITSCLASSAQLCGHVVPENPKENPPEHVITCCSAQPFARGGNKPFQAERFASHGKHPRTQVEALGGSTAEPASGEPGAGGQPDMQTPARVSGQWRKSIWLLAALSAMSDKDQLCAAPCQAPGQGWQEGGGVHESATGRGLGAPSGPSSKERGAEIVESLGKVMAESTHQLQVAMAQCNQQVLAGMAQGNQQVMNGMGTMIQTMQSMQATQQGMMQEVRGLAAMGIMGAARTELPGAAMQPPSVHGVAPAEAGGLSPQWVADQLAATAGWNQGSQ